MRNWRLQQTFLLKQLDFFRIANEQFNYELTIRFTDEIALINNGKYNYQKSRN